MTHFGRILLFLVVLATCSLAPTALAQVCAPVSVAYVVRDQNGRALSAGELNRLRSQLPPTVSGAKVVIDTNPAPALRFWNDDGDICILDLQTVDLAWNGMRMRLAFNIAMAHSPLQRVRIDGPPFRNGTFVLDKSNWRTNGQTLPATSWKSPDELVRAGTPYVAPPTDCASSVRANEGLFELRLRRQSVAERHDCLAILARMLGDSANAPLVEAAARGIARAAHSHIVDDTIVLDPLLACTRRNLNQLGMHCNRALATLTRHNYGVDFFSQPPGSPVLTQENLRRVVADWTAYRKLSALSRPIFDGYLENESVRAVREVFDSLQAIIRSTLPTQPVSSYVQAHRAAAPVTVRGGAGRGSVFHFTVGNFAAGGRPWSDYVPVDWPNESPVRAVRFMLTRPGIPQPSSGGSLNPDERHFPASAADYREEFRGIDLEFRFQILTTDPALRAAAVAAVRGALGTLREAERNRPV